MPCHEDQVALLRALAPFQVMGRPGRLAVLVGAEEGDVEVVAGELEVVRVAAEEGDGEFGGEHEADVGVFLVRVEVIAPAPVKGDDVAPQSRPVERLLLDLGDRLPPHPGRGRVDHARHDGGVHPVGDVADAHEDVQLQVGRLDFLLALEGEEAFLVVVLRGGGDLLERVGGDVVIGHHQPVGRDEGSRAPAVEPDGRRADPGDPTLVGLESVPLLELSEGQVVERPHPLVSPGEW